jgi:uncharacterized protein YlxW (UPF0749 family)
MTLVGKIFTILIFVLSILFMAFSLMVFATHKNWKDYATNTDTAKGPLGLEKQLTDAKSTNNQLNAKVNELLAKLEEERAARAVILGAMQSRVVVAEELAAAKQAELDKLYADHAQVSEAAKLAETRLAELETRTGMLANLLRDTQKDRDDQFDKVVSLTDQLNQGEGLRERMEERNNQLALQVTKMKTVMDANGLREDALVSHIPPKVEGIVLAVGDRDLIEISLGADDGLKEGHSMEVYRGNTYLGRIVIRRTAPDRAVGQVVRELQRGQIRKGDHVTTKLS